MPASGRIMAPFTGEQVSALNQWQRDPRVHPFTCARDRMDEMHRAYADALGHHDSGILRATREGWLCPVCGYRQDWAHRFMAEAGGNGTIT
jgi:hypothetical protein